MGGYILRDGGSVFYTFNIKRHKFPGCAHILSIYFGLVPRTDRFNRTKIKF